MGWLSKTTEGTNNGYLLSKGSNVTGSGRGATSRKVGVHGKVERIAGGFQAEEVEVKWADGTKGVYRPFELDATS